MPPEPGTSDRRSVESAVSDEATFGRENVAAVRNGASLHQVVEHADRPECAQGRSADRDARAIGTPARIDLDEIDVHADLAEPDRRCHAGEAAADDQGGLFRATHDRARFRDASEVDLALLR